MSNVPEDDARRPSYLQAFLFGTENTHFSLGALATAVLLSIPFGLSGLGLVGAIYGACELLGILYIPDLPTFRSRVDRQFVDAQRQVQTQVLMSQLQALGNNPSASTRIKVYHRMVQRVDTIDDMVRSGSCTLKRDDVRRLRDACRDYLQRWLASETVKQRQQDAQSADVQRKFDEVNRLLSANPVDADRRQLTAARDEYSQLLSRQQRLRSRLVAIDASLDSMPDAIEEVFQHAVSAPMATDSSERLQDAVDRLRIEEDLDADIREELGSIDHVRGRTPVSAEPNRPASASRQASADR